MIRRPRDVGLCRQLSSIATTWGSADSANAVWDLTENGTKPTTAFGRDAVCVGSTALFASDIKAVTRAVKHIPATDTLPMKLWATRGQASPHRQKQSQNLLTST